MYAANRMPRRAETRKRRTSGAFAPMGRGETPGLRGEAKRRPMPPKRPKPPHPPALRRAGVVGILCAGGFPARAAPGARINAELAAAKGRSRKAGRPAARGTAGKTF